MSEFTENDQKTRIIHHAEEKFLQHGFNKVTLDEMSSDLGISKKTMYKFFTSKEELLRTMMRLLMKKVERDMKVIFEAEQPTVQKLGNLMMYIGKFAGRFSKPFQIDIQRFTPTLWNEVDKFRNETILVRVGKMIQEAKQEGIFRDDVNEQVVMMMFINSVQSIVNPEVLSRNSFSPREALYTIFHVIFEGSLTEEARKEFRKYEILTD